MPLYEFRCPSGHDFEKFYRSIGTAPSEEKCPECGTMARRRMSAAGLVFKGSGFYITDYGKDGKKPQPTSAETPKPAEGTPAPPAAENKSGTEPKPTAEPKAAAESKPAAAPPKAE